MSKRMENMVGTHGRGSLGAAVRASAIGILISAATAGQAAGAVDPSCKPAIDAMMKQIVTPTHVYATEVSPLRGGEPRVRESIYAGGAIYVQVKGAWKRSPISTQEMQKQQEENQRHARSMSCRYLRDETVDGEAAAVYHAKSESEEVGSDATLWVSKRTGLPLRSENDIDTGYKDKRHLSIRYVYAGVRPPAGVK